MIQRIEVLNDSKYSKLRHFNYFSKDSSLVFISQGQIRVVVVLNASHIAVMIESWPLYLDLDV